MSFKVASQVHPGQMRLKYMCLSCGKMFGKEQPVKIHLNVHYGDNIYNCRFCEKVFANYSAFEVNIYILKLYFGIFKNRQLIKYLIFMFSIYKES